MEAVIVATARTPDRAGQQGIARRPAGPTTWARPSCRRCSRRCPPLDPAEVEDVIWGCAQPAGEAGYNIGPRRRAARRARRCPGVTVNRYCSSSLQTIRMAAHAIKAGEGDVFIAGGVETVSRFRSGMSDGAPGTHNAQFADAEARTEDAHAGRPGRRGSRSTGLPDIYIAMGQTAENVAEYAKVTREEMDEFAALSQQRAVASQENGFFEREITPVTTPDGTVVPRTTARAPGTTVEGLVAAQAGVPARRHRHRRQRVPAQRRRGRGAS